MGSIIYHLVSIDEPESRAQLLPAKVALEAKSEIDMVQVQGMSVCLSVFHLTALLTPSPINIIPEQNRPTSTSTSMTLYIRYSMVANRLKVR